MNKDTQSWSNSNLTEMDELLQKMQQLERENARLQMELDASCNAEELRQVRAENAALREDKEALDWIDENVEAVFFKLEPDKFRINIRESFKRARARKAKP